MSWTQERISMLVKLWLSGKSASVIATELGDVSRNAVIGKVHRLGISNRKSFAKTPSNVKEKIVVKNNKIKKKNLENHNIFIDTKRAVNKKSQKIKTDHICEVAHPNHFRIDSILNLNEKTCKWPVGHPDEAGFHFCGCPTSNSSPYCAYHMSMAYTATSSQKSDKIKIHLPVIKNQKKEIYSMQELGVYV